MIKKSTMHELASNKKLLGPAKIEQVMVMCVMVTHHVPA